MYSLLELLYSMQTTMKRTNFSRRFDKLDLHFQKVYTHSRSSGHICITVTHIRTACSFTFQHSKKPAKYKNDSQTAKSHLVSPNFSRNLFLSTFQRRNCEKNTEAIASVTSMGQNPPIEQTHFSQPAVGCERR